MGKGADTPDIPSQTTTVQQSLPAYAEPFYRELLGRAVYETSTPYQAFPGQRLADFNPAEMQAMQGIAGLGAPGQIGQATQLATQAGQAAGTPYQSGYNAGQISSGYDPTANLGPEFQPGTLADTATLQEYMNPYQQLVTDIQKREATRQSNIMGRDIGLGAAGQGSLGGYREAIMQAERQRNLGQQLGDIQAIGDQQAFQQAQRAFEADRARQLQASQLGLQRGAAQEGFQQAAERFRQGAFGLGERARQVQEQLGQSAFGLGLDAQGRQLGAAQLLGQLGSVQQGLDLDRLRSQQAAGQIQRELSQRGLDIGYQDFLRQQAFPREQLGLFSSLLQGLPIAPGSTTATFGQVPTAEQQLLGSGIAGVGLYNALGGGQ